MSVFAGKSQFPDSITKKVVAMKWNKFSILPVLLAVGLDTCRAQFDSGSTGTVALAVSPGTTVTNDLPPDGILHYTTIAVGSNATLRFRKNPLNTPVYLLAKGDVVIDGTIDVSGRGTGTNAYVGGEPGPGGFAGGAPGYLQQAGPRATAGGEADRDRAVDETFQAGATGFSPLPT